MVNFVLSDAVLSFFFTATNCSSFNKHAFCENSGLGQFRGCIKKKT